MPKITHNPTTKTVEIIDDADSPAAGFTEIGSFEHGPAMYNDSLHEDVRTHVLYHHVREALYHKGIYDMQRLTILDKS